MMEPVQEIRDRLFALQDPEYRLFQSRLMPTVDPARVIGVRTPICANSAGNWRGRNRPPLLCGSFRMTTMRKTTCTVC